jgi:hypothetical protein
MMIAPHRMNDLNAMIAASSSSMDQKQSKRSPLQKVFDETTADFEGLFQRSTKSIDTSSMSERSHQALRLSLNSDASDDDESVSSFFIAGITQKARCLSPTPRSTCNTRDTNACSRRKNGLKQRMMSANELTPTQRSNNRTLLEEFPSSARRQQLLERGSGSAVSMMAKIERGSNKSRRQSTDDDGVSTPTSSRRSGNARCLDDLKEEMERLARNQKKLLRKQKKALRALKKL